MKLLFCPYCQDVIKLQKVERTCLCGISKGNMSDSSRAEVNQDTIVLGFHNLDMKDAWDYFDLNKSDPNISRNKLDFKAFFIVKENARTILVKE